MGKEKELPIESKLKENETLRRAFEKIISSREKSLELEKSVNDMEKVIVDSALLTFTIEVLVGSMKGGFSGFDIASRICMDLQLTSPDAVASFYGIVYDIVYDVLNGYLEDGTLAYSHEAHKFHAI